MYRNVLHVHVSDVRHGKCISHLHGIHSKQYCRKCICWVGGTADLQGLWKTNCVDNLIRYHNFDFFNTSVWHAYITILGFTFSHSWMLVQENLSPEPGFSLSLLLLLLLLLSLLLIQIPAIITDMQHIYVHNCISYLLEIQ